MRIKVLPNNDARWSTVVGEILEVALPFDTSNHILYPNGGYRVIKWFGDNGPCQDIPKEIAEVQTMKNQPLS